MTAESKSPGIAINLKVTCDDLAIAEQFAPALRDMMLGMIAADLKSKECVKPAQARTECVEASSPAASRGFNIGRILDTVMRSNAELLEPVGAGGELTVWRAGATGDRVGPYATVSNVAGAFRYNVNVGINGQERPNPVFIGEYSSLAHAKRHAAWLLAFAVEAFR